MKTAATSPNVRFTASAATRWLRAPQPDDALDRPRARAIVLPRQPERCPIHKPTVSTRNRRGFDPTEAVRAQAASVGPYQQEKL